MKPAAVKIKICGLTRPEDCLVLNASRPDFAGFVFASSRRQVSAELAKKLISLLDPAIQPVGVFVDEDDGQICRITSGAGLSVIQLHGPARPDRICQLREQLAAGKCLDRVPAIWQRLPVPLDQPALAALAEAIETVRSFKASEPASGLPDLWLLDSCRPGLAGGTGKSFDWSLFQRFCLDNPVVLAGGINIENVAAALSTLHPVVVDCSSGVETCGQKDAVKIAAFCAAVRAYKQII